MASAQTLSDSQRRLVARWALACAERVLPLFDADETAMSHLRDAVTRTRTYGTGAGDTADAIRKRLIAVKAAKAASTEAGAAAARSVAQAAAVAHMGAHAFGASAYAVKAVSLTSPASPETVQTEIQWQVANLGEDERCALRLLPDLGVDSSGPLGVGLLSRGILGSTIRDIQARIK